MSTAGSYPGNDMPEILPRLSIQCSLLAPPALGFGYLPSTEGLSTRCPAPRWSAEAKLFPPASANRAPTARTGVEAGGGAGRGGTRGARAVVGPSARGAPPSVLRVSRDNLQRFPLRAQGRLIGIGVAGVGNGSPPPGPIEGLESPICKYKGLEDPKVGRARVEVRGCKTANGSVSPSFLAGARKYGC